MRLRRRRYGRGDPNWLWRRLRIYRAEGKWPGGWTILGRFPIE